MEVGQEKGKGGQGGSRQEDPKKGASGVGDPPPQGRHCTEGWSQHLGPGTGDRAGGGQCGGGRGAAERHTAEEARGHGLRGLGGGLA